MGVTTDIPFVQDNIESWGVSLEVSSLTPANLDGGTGSISFNTRDLTQPQLLRNQRFTLTDDDAGAFIGRVSQVGWSEEGGTSFTAETMLNRLNVEVTVPPAASGTLVSIIDPVLALVGMVSEGLSPSVAPRPGWNGNLLDYLKQFCMVFDYEMLPSASNPGIITFRPIRTTTFDPYLMSASFDVNDQQLAQGVEIHNYAITRDFNTNVEVSPAATTDAQILTVNAGEKVTYDLELSAWVASVNQPAVLDYVGPEERSDVGAYCVAGSDGLPIAAAQWTATGGDVTVEVTDNPSIVRVTVTAPQATTLLSPAGEERFSPYSIAATAGDGTLYNSLHITGSATRWEKQTVSLPTGVVSEVTVEPVGVTVDNVWVNTLDTAYSLGTRAAQTFAGPTYTISNVSTSPNSSLRQIVGARFDGDEVKFRVQSVSATESGVDCSGVMDTTFGDFSAAMPVGMTFDQWSAAVPASMTFDEWAVVPLKKG